MAATKTSGQVKVARRASSGRGVQAPTGRGKTKAALKAAFQFKNELTGHFITQNAEGTWVVKTDGEPFEGVEIKRVILAAPNPSVDPETAQLGEEAVLEFFNSRNK